MIICTSHAISDSVFYLFVFLLGFMNGYWVMAITMASEQFGTNIRSTVTNTVPNFVRGAVVPITLLFRYFERSVGNGLSAAIYVCLICSFLAILAFCTFLTLLAKNWTMWSIEQNPDWSTEISYCTEITLIPFEVVKPGETGNYLISKRPKVESY